MTISLKKALRARKELEALINGMNLPLSTRLSLFADETWTNPLAVIAVQTAVLDGKVDEKLRASAVLANLRKAISKANEEFGVEGLLADQAHVDRSLALWKSVAGSDTTAPEAILKGELKHARTLLDKDAPTGRIGFSSAPDKAVTASTVSDELKQKAEAEILRLRRLKEEIEDKRVAVNAGQRITLADDDLNFLRERGII